MGKERKVKVRDASFFYRRDGVLPGVLAELTYYDLIEPTRRSGYSSSDDIKAIYEGAGLSRVRQTKVGVPGGCLLSLDGLLSGDVVSPVVVKMDLHVTGFKQWMMKYDDLREARLMREKARRQSVSFEEMMITLVSPDGTVYKSSFFLPEEVSSANPRLQVKDDFEAVLPVALSDYHASGKEGLFNYGLFVRFGPSNRELIRGGAAGRDSLVFAYWSDPAFAMDVSRRVASVVERPVVPLYRPKGRKCVNNLELLPAQRL